MIDYSNCTKEELIELLEHYTNLIIIHTRPSLFRADEPVDEAEVYLMLKDDGLKVKYVESEGK